ncbi:MAG: FtsW/RodA/SpoVE family cell cycle protein [Lachnospiraceae bacterium]|nr:FtsW/RodA/SpoVE family cell cycle protein [Lachnospiraceae bacterium]
MEEYMKNLTEQIRHKKARTAVEEEIRQHIEEQIESYEVSGMEHDEAVRRAIRDMGDPVTAGIELDRIHRPRMAWGMVSIIAIISLCSILLQMVIGQNDTELGWNHVIKHAVHIVTGFGVMLLVYRLDYTFIGRYAKCMTVLLAVYFCANIFFVGLEMNGARAWAYIPGIGVISLRVLQYLFIPLYAGILYTYRGSGYVGVVKSILWMLLSIFISRCLYSVTVMLQLIFIMALLLSFAVYKNWFQIKKIPFLVGLWTCLVVVPAVCLFFAIRLEWMATYRIERIRAMFSLTQRAENYLALRIREYMNSSLVFGNSGTPFEGYMPSYESEHVMVFIASYYGIAIAVLAFVVLLCLSIRMFGISLRQKNQLGMIIGCGCGLVFVMQICVHLIVNTGLTATTTWLPFFSSGGTGILVSYILLGIVLSIYRYKEILPNNIKILPTNVKGLKIPRISIIIER